jgi:hypothetical protein
VDSFCVLYLGKQNITKLKHNFMRKLQLRSMLFAAAILAFTISCSKDDDNNNGNNGGNNTPGDGITTATVHTSEVTMVEQTSVLVRGSVSKDGGATVTRRGFVWATSSNPTLSNNVVESGDGTGAFSEPITGLTKNTLYYVRAFATNSKGTSYGSNIGFNTLGDPAIGQLGPGGGYIFHLDGSGGGLVAAPDNSEFTWTVWGCSGTAIGGTSSNIGSGLANTIAIANGCSDDNIAAKLCLDLEAGGFSDWYLPSRDELAAMYSSLKAQGTGGFTDGYYWCSTEDDFQGAWFADFNNGAFTVGDKANTFVVRAIRKF